MLNTNQSGFRPGDSTVNQLISITHTIFKAFDCNPSLDVRSVYLDISKAFDRAWHDEGVSDDDDDYDVEEDMESEEEASEFLARFIPA